MDEWNSISSLVQSHLYKVYKTLIFAVFAISWGVYLHTQYNIGTFLSTLGCVVCNMWQLTIPRYQELLSGKRFWILMAVWTFAGSAIGPSLDLAIEIDPSCLLNAFVGTAVAFLCFSIVALSATRTRDLYLRASLYPSLVEFYDIQDWGIRRDVPESDVPGALASRGLYHC